MARLNMKFALINGQRQEAQPNLSGQCPACGKVMIAKCGEVKIWHWAHKGHRTCDTWWENETEWHRAWKGQFPESWQEIIHKADNGEKHIADVKTDQGWVIEFQHSYIKPEERQSRDSFYEKLVWVVDGARRKKDRVQFFHTLNRGVRIGSNSLIRIPILDDCILLREWTNSHALVFFDFGGEHALWWLLKGSASGIAYVAAFPRNEFIEIHRDGATQKARDFFAFVKDVSKLISQYESHFRVQALRMTRPRPVKGFQQYMIRKNKLRRRF